MRLTEKQRKEIILKASVEIGPLYKYTIKHGGLGLTLVVDASTKEKARVARRITPPVFEKLQTLVIYRTEPDESADS